MLSNREEIFHTIRKKLLKAQAIIKHHADVKRREVTYQPGDWVLLKLRPYQQRSVKGAHAVSDKLAMHFYDPFQILDRIGPVAYHL